MFERSNLQLEAILSLVQWQRLAPEDRDRPECRTMGHDRLMGVFDNCFRYDDRSITPVNYEAEDSLMRRGLIAGIALLRDAEEFVLLADHTQLHS